MSFSIHGIDSRENKTFDASTGTPGKYFFTEEQYKENRKNFVPYMLALFGIILVSIPTIAVNFKKLLNK